MCSTIWWDREHFLNDKSLVMNGYQVNFNKLGEGLFYFTHNEASCFSTMAIAASEFFDLHHQSQRFERKTGSDECPGYCLKKEILERCETDCECAFVRDIIDTIRKRMEHNS